MFVIVYLVESKAHTVIPQEFIFKLNQENLCNNGVNSNQHRLIYFSKEIFDLLQNGVDPQAFVPKFYIPVTNAYPLPDGVVETCFIARLKKFWVSFDDALAHVERMRPLLPAMYNEAREFEEPIPPFVWRDAQNQADELDLNLQNNEAIEEIDVKPIAFENILVDEFDAAALNILFNGEPLEDDNIVEAEQNSERSDTSVKQRPENDPLENDTATNEESVQQIKEISSDLAANIQIERGNVQVKTPIENVLPESSAQNTVKQAEQSVSSTTSQARNMTKCYDKKYDVEITFQSMDDFRPKVDSEYEMKPNDILSNNRPFMRNLNGDRAFKINVRGEFKDKWLSAQVVNGLVELNGKKRNDTKVDKVFLKALVIGACTLKPFKEPTETSPFEGGVLELIKDLFEARVANDDKDKKRIGAFDSLIKSVCDEIRKKFA